MPWSKKATDDEAWNEIPDRGILAVDLAGKLAWPLSRVTHSLRRMERQGRVYRLKVDVSNGTEVYEWHPVKVIDWEALEGELFAILLVNPHGLSVAELALEAQRPDELVGQALARMQDACQVMPQCVETNTWVWLAVLPEDGDQ